MIDREGRGRKGRDVDQNKPFNKDYNNRWSRVLLVVVKAPEGDVKRGRCDAGLECSLQATAQNSNGQTNQP